MKVLMFDAAFPPPIVGGKEKQAYILAKELVSLGIDVEAFSYFHNKNTSGYFDGITTKRILRTPIFCLPYILFYMICKRFSFSILHVHTPSRIGKFVSLVGLVLGYKLVFKFPGQGIIENSTGISSYFMGLIIKYSRMLVVLENDTCTKLKLRLKKHEKRKIFFAYNGVEILKKKPPCENKPFKILFIGRLVSIKRCEDLISACNLLDVTKINWELNFVGDGPLLNKLKSLVNEFNIDNRVIFWGNQKDTVQFLKTANVLVLPSKSEGMSNVLLESMSVGLPIVATDVGSARRQVGLFGKQFLCMPFHPEEIAQKINLLATRPTLMDEYGSYLYERSKKLFSIEAVSKKYLEKYKQL